MITVQFRNGQHHLLDQDGQPAAVGTYPGGLNPKGLMEAAVGMCMTITLSLLLQRDGLARDDMVFSATVTAVKHPSANRMERFETRLTFPDHLEEAYIQKTIPKVERGCTIGNTIRNGATITVER